MNESVRSNPEPPPSDAGELETLRARYARVCNERDRLRNARGFFARPLGPAPTTAGISTTLVATLEPHPFGLFWVLALVSLGALIVVGLLYDGLPAYRHLYARELAGVRHLPSRRERQGRSVADAVLDTTEPTDPVQWYRLMIERESAIVGPPTQDNAWRLPYGVTTLQEGMDAERTGLRLTQALWVLVMVFLLLAVLV